MSKSRLLGWLGVGAIFAWLYADYQQNFRKAIFWGWVTVALTAAHIWTAK